MRYNNHVVSVFTIVCLCVQSVCVAFLVLLCFLSWNCWLVSEKPYELFVMCHTMVWFVKLSTRRINRWDVSVPEQFQLIATIAIAIKIAYIPFAVLRVCKNIDFLSHKLDGKCKQKWMCKRNILSDICKTFLRANQVHFQFSHRTVSRAEETFRWFSW